MVYFTLQVVTAKQSLLTNMEKRFVTHNTEPMLIISTFLDPRFKHRFVSVSLNDVEAMIIEAFQARYADCSSVSTGEPQPSPSPNTVVMTAAAPAPPNNNENTSAPTSTASASLWDVFTEMSQPEDTTTQSQSQFMSDEDRMEEQVTKLKAEIQTYSSLVLLDQSGNIYGWWKANIQFPLLKAMAREYLAAPAASVYSEQLWSEGGNVYNEKRSRLLPENGEKLIFLHHNLPIVEQLFK